MTQEWPMSRLRGVDVARSERNCPRSAAKVLKACMYVKHTLIDLAVSEQGSNAHIDSIQRLLSNIF